MNPTFTSSQKSKTHTASLANTVLFKGTLQFPTSLDQQECHNFLRQRFPDLILARQSTSAVAVDKISRSQLALLEGRFPKALWREDSKYEKHSATAVDSTLRFLNPNWCDQEGEILTPLTEILLRETLKRVGELPSDGWRKRYVARQSGFKVRNSSRDSGTANIDSEEPYFTIPCKDFSSSEIRLYAGSELGIEFGFTNVADRVYFTGNLIEQKYEALRNKRSSKATRSIPSPAVPDLALAGLYRADLYERWFTSQVNLLRSQRVSLARFENKFRPRSTARESIILQVEKEALFKHPGHPSSVYDIRSELLEPYGGQIPVWIGGESLKVSASHWFEPLLEHKQEGVSGVRKRASPRLGLTRLEDWDTSEPRVQRTLIVSGSDF